MSLKTHMDAVLNGVSETAAGTADNGQLPAQRRKGSGSIPATTTLLHYSKDLSDELQSLRGSQGKALVLPLDQIDDSPYQLGTLEEERVDALMRNLVNNPLSTPITVRRKDGGRYEIVAGHHRRAAYVRLQRPAIEAVLVELNDEQASDLVFFDNLLAPSVSAYDKYLGLARIQARGLTQEQIAKRAGLQQNTVSGYLQFDALPEAAKEFIASHKQKVPVAVAKALGPLSDGNPDKVIEAITKIILEGKTVQWAVGYVKGETKGTKPVVGNERVIKRGKKSYATLASRDRKLIVTFVDPEESAAVEKLLLELLRARADAGARS